MRFKPMLAAGLTLTLSAPPLLAHPGQGAGDGLAAGLLHPLLGLDHLLAIVAVGLWSTLAVRRVKLTGAAFLFAMGLGAALGCMGLALPFAEAGVAGSVLAAGLLVAALVRAHPFQAGALAAVFALFHGNVHGLELPASASAAAYVLGMLATTLALLTAGAGLGRLRGAESSLLPRAAGLGVAVVGGWLLIG